MTASVAALVAIGVLGLTSASGDQADHRSAAAASSRYSCGAGRIRNVQSVTEIVTVRAASRRPSGSADTIDPLPLESKHTHQYFVVTVRFDRMFYVIRAAADTGWNLNPMTFRFDESIAVCVNTTEMILDRLDGTDFRGRVIRVQSDEAPFVPPGR